MTGGGGIVSGQAIGCRAVSGAQAADADWLTEQCTLSFGVAGVWPEASDGNEINSCDRSRDKTLLCCAHDSGALRLFRYPANQPKVSLRGN